MKEIVRIADQLRRAVEGDAWHGPSLHETLARVTAQGAAARPISGGHTPWEIALHIGAWLAAVRRRLGGQAVELSPREDWPPVGDSSEAAWEQARGGLDGDYRQLLESIRGLPENALGNVVAGRDYSTSFMLDGVIQHTLYHTGQIAVLTKASSDPRREMLRHTLATLAYRGGKALRDAPTGFAGFRAGETTRTAGEILAHVGDLLDWALSIAKGQETWREAEPLPWERGAERFFAALGTLDARLASGAPLQASAEKMFQGPIADALTHVGQIALLRRLAGSPVRGESYFRADIALGRVGPEQSAPRREFD